MTHPSLRARADRAAWEADEALLVARLHRLGLERTVPVELHLNRSVMVSVTERSVLRIHRGFAYGSDRVLRAIVAFIAPRTPRSERERARRLLSEFPAESYVPVRRRRRQPTHPTDRRLVGRLRRLYAELNDRHFGGALHPVPLRVSSRMVTRLGEVTVDARAHRAVEIAISRLHVVQDGWDEVRDTLLHEMIHQWQVETGGEPDHGKRFRRKAREVGITPAARRAVGEAIHMIER
ncbi:MAG: SprT-like domain-containing protein [Gemmatimonadota bacterium]|nr:SprT-like domain-containing protein [Gemmatimonadota bacterium]MDH3368282.1 SprT-like domain-containing protein [Gemmatimonadota bacterium]MDH3478062.1 SprT-like domain-containing protein [Gemmatimonadota bacterium]MDH3571178.1 SprT-like domain-containing protein [Gemmatimonadota bacterium]MDH5550937.1 SprT-like domain-containing protein [Gemmatimonadota bacterium]